MNAAEVVAVICRRARSRTSVFGRCRQARAKQREEVDESRDRGN